MIKQETSYELSTGVFATIENFKEIYDIGKMFASSSLVPTDISRQGNGLHYS